MKWRVVTLAILFRLELVDPKRAQHKYWLLKGWSPQGHKSRLQRDHRIPAGYNISHLLHDGHKSNSAESWLSRGTCVPQNWYYSLSLLAKRQEKTVVFTSKTEKIENIIVHTFSLWRQYLIWPCICGSLLSGWEVVADRHDKQERVRRDDCLGFTAAVRSPSSWP